METVNIRIKLQLIKGLEKRDGRLIRLSSNERIKANRWIGNRAARISKSLAIDPQDLNLLARRTKSFMLLALIIS